jgi:transposase-like protein
MLFFHTSLKLTEADQRYLTEMISKGQVQARMVRRAELNQGATIQAVAETLRVKHWTVSIWRNKYGESGLDFFARPAAVGSSG